MIRWMWRRLVMVETVAALAAAWVLVFVVPFRITAARLGRVGAPTDDGPIDPAKILRARYVCRRVARVAPHMPWRTTCLVQATTGLLLLKRRGIAATIRFGVKKNDGVLAAHAWLIVGGETLLGGAAAEGFTPLADMGGKAR